jgi:hypothetical protein
MNLSLNVKRVALLTGLTLVPVAAFAAAAASGSDGGLCKALFGMVFNCGGGCPG